MLSEMQLQASLESVGFDWAQERFEAAAPPRDALADVFVQLARSTTPRRGRSSRAVLPTPTPPQPPTIAAPHAAVPASLAIAAEMQLDFDFASFARQ